LHITKSITDNDVYILAVAAHRVVINLDYKGVLILDERLNELAQVELFDGIIHQDAFIGGDCVVLHCEERCFVHVDTRTCACTVIPYDEALPELPYLHLYQWVGDALYLLASGAVTIVKVDIKAKIARIADEVPAEITLRRDWEKLKAHKYMVWTAYPDRPSAVVEAGSQLLETDYLHDTSRVLEIERIEEFHDIEAYQGYVAQISEKQVAVSYQGKTVRIQPPGELAYFMHGKFLTANNEDCIVLLSGRYDDSKVNRLDLYSLQGGLFS